MLIDLDDKDISLILTALSKGTYEVVAPLINKISGQVNKGGQLAANGGTGATPRHTEQ